MKENGGMYMKIGHMYSECNLIVGMGRSGVECCSGVARGDTGPMPPQLVVNVFLSN